MTTPQKVLVLSPHPDDETLGCGGTIRLLAEAGAQVDVVCLTRGERGAEAPAALGKCAQDLLAETRMHEARQAGAILGVRHVDFLAGSDGGLAEQHHLADEVQRRLLANGYNRVFCPWSQDKHPDHVATFQLLRQALQACDPRMQVWLYEVWAPLQPNICVPIDTVIDIKAAAIEAYQSQLRCLDYLSAFRGLAAYRGLFSPATRYAEAFIACEAASICES